MNHVDDTIDDGAEGSGKAAASASSSVHPAASVLAGEAADRRAIPAASTASSIADTAQTPEFGALDAVQPPESASHDASATIPGEQVGKQCSSGSETAPAEKITSAVAEALALAEEGNHDADTADAPQAELAQAQRPATAAGLPNGDSADAAESDGMLGEDESCASEGPDAPGTASSSNAAGNPPAGSGKYAGERTRAGVAEGDGGDPVNSGKPTTDARPLDRPVTDELASGADSHPSAELAADLTDQPSPTDEADLDEQAIANTEEAETTSSPAKPPLTGPDSSKIVGQQQSAVADGPDAARSAEGPGKPDKLHMVGSIPDMSAAWKAKVAVSDATQVGRAAEVLQLSATHALRSGGRAHARAARPRHPHRRTHLNCSSRHTCSACAPRNLSKHRFVMLRSAVNGSAATAPRRALPGLHDDIQVWLSRPRVMRQSWAPCTTPSHRASQRRGWTWPQSSQSGAVMSFCQAGRHLPSPMTVNHSRLQRRSYALLQACMSSPSADTVQTRPPSSQSPMARWAQDEALTRADGTILMGSAMRM